MDPLWQYSHIALFIFQNFTKWSSEFLSHFDFLLVKKLLQPQYQERRNRKWCNTDAQGIYLIVGVQARVGF